MPIVTLTSSTDSIVMTGDDPTPGSFTYRTETLTSWYKLWPADMPNEKRPNAHGSYGVDRIYSQQAKPVIKGQYWASGLDDAAVARRRINGMFADGKSIVVTVVDELGTFSRRVNVVEGDPVWTTDGNFEFQLDTVAPDPRRYGIATLTDTGIPTTGTGLTWPLGSSSSGLYWDWGTPGNLGQVSFTNYGNASTQPSFRITGGDMTGGFRITELETGRQLTYTTNVIGTDVMVLSGSMRTLTINGGGNFVQRLTARQWFSIPPGATRRYQWTPLGATTGQPILQLIASSADL